VKETHFSPVSMIISRIVPETDEHMFLFEISFETVTIVTNVASLQVLLPHFLTQIPLPFSSLSISRFPFYLLTIFSGDWCSLCIPDKKQISQ
jgi:hypothetical protein